MIEVYWVGVQIACGFWATAVVVSLIFYVADVFYADGAQDEDTQRAARILLLAIVGGGLLTLLWPLILPAAVLFGIGWVVLDALPRRA